MNKVVDRLWIGSHHDMSERLRESGIQVILKLYPDQPRLLSPPPGFILYDRPVIDGQGWGKQEFTGLYALMCEQINAGNNLLVVCAAGKSRSAVTVLNYMLYQGWTLSGAMAHLKRCRPQIDPNIHLLAALIEHHHLHPYLSTVDSRWT